MSHRFHVRALAIAALTAVADVDAQTCFYTVDSDPAGISSSGAAATGLMAAVPSNEILRTQILIPIGVFQNVPALVTDVAVGVRSGWRTYAFDELTIRLGHTTVQQLHPTFAQNITSPLQDVLVVRDHVWREGQGPTWVPLGLQQAFQVLPGSGNLLIEIVTRGVTVLEQVAYTTLGTGNVGSMIRAFGQTLPSQTFSSAVAPPRLRFCIDRAEVLLHGETCPGSAGSTPLLGVTGRPTPGGTSTLWLSDAPPNAPAACAYGFDTRPPFPMDLTPVGAPGCRQYFPSGFADVVVASTLGIGLRHVAVPASPATIGAILYAQYFVLDPPGNALGLTASNYARLLVGL